MAKIAFSCFSFRVMVLFMLAHCHGLLGYLKKSIAIVMLWVTHVLFLIWKVKSSAVTEIYRDPKATSFCNQDSLSFSVSFIVLFWKHVTYCWGLLSIFKDNLVSAAALNINIDTTKFVCIQKLFTLNLMHCCNHCFFFSLSMI